MPCLYYSFCDPGIPLPPSVWGWENYLSTILLRFENEQLVLMGILSLISHSAVITLLSGSSQLAGRQPTNKPHSH